MSVNERFMGSYASYATRHFSFFQKHNQASVSENTEYHGTIYHIFFHSLIIYPELAYTADEKGSSYESYMITRDQFNSILSELYRNNYILIDIASIYSVDASGAVSQKPLFIPKGKKPLIISLDDLSYYSYMRGRGFANKLVLDTDGRVATEVITPKGETVVTRDGDVVPILDDFVASHPDFSQGNAKGVIALTGFEGILGYRTDSRHASSSEAVGETLRAIKVAQVLKSEGWKFASHSYSHDHSFLTGSISLDDLKKDTQEWDNEVKPLVGNTDIFIGPFGQIFSVHDPRRNYLISRGFRMFCGVGMDLYLHYFHDHVMMNRADIDGYRISHNPIELKGYFEVAALKNE